MELKDLKKNWERFAQVDPMWAILTDPTKKGGKWAPSEFFMSGIKEVDATMAKAHAFGFSFATRRALDFGCGVGRITQGLCRYFEQVYGVDIAPTMIEQAQKYNSYGSRCNYQQNDSSDLQIFEKNYFDFIYSNIVLQHMRPEFSTCYIQEFARILVRGGLLVFQIPSELRKDVAGLTRSTCEQALPPGSFQARLSTDCLELHASPGDVLNIPLRVENLSRADWPAFGCRNGKFQVFVGNHWLDSAQNMITYDDSRAVLGQDLCPGNSIRMNFSANVPVHPGAYWLELDMGQEGVTWFKDWNSPTLFIKVIVGDAGQEAVVKRKSRNRFSLHSLFRRAMRSDVSNHPLPATPAPVMEMHAVHRDRVRELIEGCGAKLLRIEDDFDAGPDWISFRYWVTK